MSDFYKLLHEMERAIYAPNNLHVQLPKEEEQNEKYGAGVYKLSGQTIRFRMAKTTPKKLGQFVAFWEKDENNTNQPYTYEDAPALLVITTMKDEKRFGQFVFPKEVLYKQGILRTNEQKGKMGMRVYPVWDKPTSMQARKTQAWQLPYFVDIVCDNQASSARIKELYRQA